MRGAKGFTLVELLIVMAIVAIMAAVAVPNLVSTTFPHMKLKSTAMNIYSTLQLCRSRAIGSTQQYGIEFNLGANPATFRIMQRPNSTAVWTVDPSFSTKQVDLAVKVDNITVDAVNYTAGTAGVIRFESVGTASSADIRLRGVNNVTDKYSLTVASSTGRVKIQRGW